MTTKKDVKQLPDEKAARQMHDLAEAFIPASNMLAGILGDYQPKVVIELWPHHFDLFCDTAIRAGKLEPDFKTKTFGGVPASGDIMFAGFVWRNGKF